MPLLTGTLTHFSNPKSDPTLEYSNAQREILSVAASKQAIADISQWPGYKETPLHAFTSMAAKVGIAQLWYKDESQRFGLKSFKALGGAYAVARQLQIEIFNRFGKTPSITELLDGKWKSEVAEIVVSCATDGNKRSGFRCRTTSSSSRGYPWEDYGPVSIP